jgi:hypothetical protein
MIITKELIGIGVGMGMNLALSLSILRRLDCLSTRTFVVKSRLNRELYPVQQRRATRKQDQVSYHILW